MDDYKISEVKIRLLILWSDSDAFNYNLFFCQRYHIEDGRTAGRYVLMKMVQSKYTIKLKGICWLLVQLTHLINARNVEHDI
jgi:hypothetical protein